LALPGDWLQSTVTSAMSGFFSEGYQRTIHGFEAPPGHSGATGGVAVAEPNRWLNNQLHLVDQQAVADPLQIWRMLQATKASA
jgi:hypothetical protein